MGNKLVRVMQDWTNRIARPTSEYNEANPGHAYSPEQYEERRGFDAYLLAGRAVFTDLGHAQAIEMAGDAPVVAYVGVLHTHTPESYASTAWPFPQAEGELLDGTWLLNVEGEPAVRWYAQDPRWNQYATDPAQVDPAAWAELVVDWATRRYPVAGVFLDYLAELPWTYPQDPEIHLEDGGLLWRSWQIRAVWELRQRAPELLIVANGRWAATMTGWTHGGLVDAVYLEKFGTLWWDPAEAMGLLRKHKRPLVTWPLPGFVSHREGWIGRHLLDTTNPGNPRSRDYNLEQLADAVGYATGWARSDRWSRR